MSQPIQQQNYPPQPVAVSPGQAPGQSQNYPPQPGPAPVAVPSGQPPNYPPQPQQPYPQPVMMAPPGAVHYVSGQPGVQFVPVQQQMVYQNAPAVPPPPADLKPSHNLLLTIIVTAACFIFNISSLIIGVPALICAHMAYNALLQQRYTTTKNLGYAAVALSVFNVAYTGIVSIVIVGVTIGVHCNPHRYDNYYHYYYYDYDRC